MKRKLFTLLFALVALASFQVSAATPVWWIWADTTGIIPTSTLPYGADKADPLLNWLISTGTNTAGINKSASILNDGAIGKFTVEGVTGSTHQLYINMVDINGANPRRLKWNSGSPVNNWEKFEVVRFTGDGVSSPYPNVYPAAGNGIRTVQQYNDVDGVFGYLMPAQGSTSNLMDTTAYMWMVVVNNKTNVMDVKRVDEVFQKEARTGKVIWDSIPVPRIVPINWNNVKASFGTIAIAATDTVTVWTPQMPPVGTPTTPPLWVSYQSSALSRVGSFAAAGIRYNGNVDPIHAAIQGTNTSIVYLAIDPTTVFPSDPTKLYDPSNLTAYVGPAYGTPGWNPSIFTNWTNGYPWCIGSGAIMPNATSGRGPTTGPGAIGTYVIFRVENNLLAKVGNPGAVTNSGAVNPGINWGGATVNGVDYTTITNGASIYDFRGLRYAGDWRPVWIKLEKPHGRWATTEDFLGDCRYKEFKNLPVAIDPEDLAKNPRTDKLTNIFRVTQVDYISLDARQSGSNIFSNHRSPFVTPAGNTGDDYQGTKFYDPAGRWGLGMQEAKTTRNGNIGGITRLDSVIPLFILSSPENSCEVVSVSRQNELGVQHQPDGVYGNRLELRPYGTYYDYHRNTTTNKWEYWSHDALATAATAPGSAWDEDGTGSPVLDELRVATSLQKFAIWITENGDKTVYPVASYFWEYGEVKNPVIGSVDAVIPQKNIVLPNSVLIYNNTDISRTIGGGGTDDMNWGAQIDTWLTAQETLAGEITSPSKDDIVTGPNKIQTITNYDKLKLDIDCPKLNNDPIDGRFYFLQVDKDVIDVPKDVTTTGDDAYQATAKTDYVLSIEYINGVKKLVVVPKERVRRYDDTTGLYTYDNLKDNFKRIEKSNDPASLLKDYWTSNPYDSVNMAAHWGIYKSGDQYVLINMLGDTLQYNTDDTNPGYPQNLKDVTGGYMTINSNISDDGLFSPVGSDDTHWFGKNPLTKADYLWDVDFIPGKGGFVLSLNGYTLALDGSWYGKKLARKNSLTLADSLYYQVNVQLYKNEDVDVLDSMYNYKGDNFDCAGGLVVTKEPIYYVPNYSGSYKTEDKGIDLATQATINTNDPKFKDSNARVEKDSLTAYLLLDGYYGIREAEKVDNDLFLSAKLNEDGRNAAVFTKGAGKEVQFIPLVSVATQRNGNISTAGGGLGALNSTDALYGETYKWFLVKLGEQYLVFDTLNLTATLPHLKLGFVFKNVDIANATPVRLYQPLVGDKLQGNFLFEFYAPVKNYNVATPASTFNYTWSAIDPDVRPGHRYFGQLSVQSNYIHAVPTKQEATRFTYDLQGGPDTCEGCEQFIDPEWMASQKLLTLPIENQVWTQSKTGYAFDKAPDHVKNKNHTDNENEAIISHNFTDTKGGFSKIKHIFVDSIRKSAPNQGYTYKIGTTTYQVNTFVKDLDVALYYVVDSRADGDYYLTVDTTTYQYNRSVTVPDVTGTNLSWRKGLLPLNTNKDKNLRALQLFAITGIESTKLEDDWYTYCGTFVYLPLASYKVDYANGVVLKNDIIHYNIGLGKNLSPGSGVCNDPTPAFRVAYSVPLDGRNQNNLIVANSTGQVNGTNVVPVEFKWRRLDYDLVGCDYQLVQNNSTKKYYVGGTTINKADTNTIIAHWKLENQLADIDPYIHKFTPEIESVTNYGPAAINFNTNTTLTGDFYFLKNSDGGDVHTAIRFNNYKFFGVNDARNYTVDPLELVITCVDHTLPFYKLEEEYILPDKMAVIETPFTDRNLSDIVKGKDFPYNNIRKNKDLQAYLDQVGIDFADANFLKAYKTYERKLANGLNDDGTGHDIWYYSFSLIGPDGGEYFLNVLPKEVSKSAADSVYWTKLSPTEIEDLTHLYSDVTENQYLTEASNKKWRTYKFCLPYQWNINGLPKLQDSVAYGEKNYPPVYLQTLDTTLTDFPYLVIAGSATSYVTAKQLNNALQTPADVAALTTYNIYGIDYSRIDPKQVTAWIFGGEKGPDHEWVPLTNMDGKNPWNNKDDLTYDPTNYTVDGLLTNYKLGTGGMSFVNESDKNWTPDKTTVNYGILLTPPNPMLKFEYEGTERIGTYDKKPIYYYRIQAPSGGWLTDSYTYPESKYIFTWGDGTATADYKLAFFGPRLADKTGWKYDEDFIQTFGLRYTGVESGVNVVAGDNVSGKTFTVVSNTHYEGTNPPEYRYLSEVGDHLVFVKDIKNALLFQFGRNTNPWTDITVVGQGEIFGVSGGVRILNQTGTVGLYTIDGRLIKSVEITGADQTITAPRGVVIVKADGKATKVVVK